MYDLGAKALIEESGFPSAKFTRMSSKEDRSLIINYWFRKTIAAKFTIKDIIKIIVEFAEEIEIFDASISSKYIKLEEDNCSVFFPSRHERAEYGIPQAPNPVEFSASVFGIVDATPGHKYHWKIKIIGDTNPNIGIIEADKCLAERDEFADHWWIESYGYSISLYGWKYHNNSSAFYAGIILSGEIDVWLDMKDNYDLSYGHNGKEYGTAWNVDKHKTYKLAIGLYYGRVELVHFKVDD